MKAMIIVAIGLIAMAGCVNKTSENDNYQYDIKQFEQVVETLQVEEPTPRRPLQMSVALVPEAAAPGESVRAVIKIRLQPGWHFYEYVPEGEAYIQTKWLMELGDGLQPVGDWNGPEAIPYYGNPLISVYQGGLEPLVFYYEFTVGEKAKGDMLVKAGMHFQTCDVNMCLPAKTHTEDLVLKVHNH